VLLEASSPSDGDGGGVRRLRLRLAAAAGEAEPPSAAAAAPASQDVPPLVVHVSAAAAAQVKVDGAPCTLTVAVECGHCACTSASLCRRHCAFAALEFGGAAGEENASCKPCCDEAKRRTHEKRARRAAGEAGSPRKPSGVERLSASFRAQRFARAHARVRSTRSPLLTPSLPAAGWSRGRSRRFPCATSSRGRG